MQNTQLSLMLGRKLITTEPGEKPLEKQRTTHQRSSSNICGSVENRACSRPQAWTTQWWETAMHANPFLLCHPCHPTWLIFITFSLPAEEAASAAMKEFTFYTGACTGDENQALNQIRINFLNAIKNTPLAKFLLCDMSQDLDCVVSNVKIYCGSR